MQYVAAHDIIHSAANMEHAVSVSLHCLGGNVQLLCEIAKHDCGFMGELPEQSIKCVHLGCRARPAGAWIFLAVLALHGFHVHQRMCQELADAQVQLQDYPRLGPDFQRILESEDEAIKDVFLLGSRWQVHGMHVVQGRVFREVGHCLADITHHAAEHDFSSELVVIVIGCIIWVQPIQQIFEIALRVLDRRTRENPAARSAELNERGKARRLATVAEHVSLVTNNAIKVHLLAQPVHEARSAIICGEGHADLAGNQGRMRLKQCPAATGILCKETHTDAGLDKRLLPLRYQDRWCQNKRLWHGVVQQQTDGRPGLAEAHLIGQNTTTAYCGVFSLTTNHPADARLLVCVVAEFRKGGSQHLGEEGRKGRKGSRVAKPKMNTPVIIPAFNFFQVCPSPRSRDWTDVKKLIMITKIVRYVDHSFPFLSKHGSILPLYLPFRIR